MSGARFLCLGAGKGWHSAQLQHSAAAQGATMAIATYESIAATIESGQTVVRCEAGRLDSFDAILTRTMPGGSLETITFRLATLHHLQAAVDAPSIINPPRALEIAIDKFATLARVGQLGYDVPETIVVQSRSEAMEAVASLGGDCIVKPIFGGEGRGVMRVNDRELAWTVFSTLQQIDAVMYVQRFVPPGGVDTRMLVIGDQVVGLRRSNDRDFRANVSGGGHTQPVELSAGQITMARRICESIGLSFAAVDLVHDVDGHALVIEVNAIPGWKGAQSVTPWPIADQIIRLLHRSRQEVGCR